MGRRSDHSRAQLEAMIVAEGHRLLAETGFAAFSAREVARRVGYSIGTIYNVFSSLDQLLIAINGLTFELWTEYLGRRVDQGGGDRIRALVQAYFDFAREHPKLWMAIYDHRLPTGMAMAPEDMEKRRALTQIVFVEIAYLFNCRSLNHPIHAIGPFSNRWAIGGALAMMALSTTLGWKESWLSTSTE